MANGAHTTSAVLAASIIMETHASTMPNRILYAAVDVVSSTLLLLLV